MKNNDGSSSLGVDLNYKGVKSTAMRRRESIIYLSANTLNPATPVHSGGSLWLTYEKALA